MSTTVFELGAAEAMIKIAATMQQIRAAAKRVGHKPMPKNILQAFGALAVPTSRVMRTGTKNPEVRHIRRLQNKIIPKPVRAAIAKASRKVYKNPEMHGQILMTKNPSRVLDPTVGKARKENVKAVINLHEQFERAAKIRRGSLHANPTVLAKEHNLLSRLTGKGANKVRRSFNIRGPEYEHLKSQLTQKFGPRAAEFMAAGQKIPRAMRRAMDKKKFQLTPAQATRIGEKQMETLLKKTKQQGAK